MRVLLTEGSGLTSREVGALAHRAGHEVAILTSDPRCLARWSVAVRAVHRVPRFADDPHAWLDAAVATARRGGYDVLLPTQEQAAAIARDHERVTDAGVRTVVPPFAALAAVQDKVSAAATLARLGVPTPPTHVLAREDDLAGWREFPVFVKAPIGTASSGVARIEGPAALAALATAWRAEDPWADGGVVVQTPAPGPLAMVQSVFDDGRLVAWHANLRVSEGVRGGAAHKVSVDLPEARSQIARLGAELRWHGALSADVIVTAAGPLVIDVNPRLVEPVNAALAGVDLVGPLLDLAQGRHPPEQAVGAAGVHTHQTLLAVLGAAAGTGRRREVAKALVRGVRGRADSVASVDEVQFGHGARGAIPLAVAAITTLVRPRWWAALAGASVAHYALTPDAWRAIRHGR